MKNASIFSVFVNVFVRQNGSSDMEKKSGHCLKLASVYCFVNSNISSNQNYQFKIFGMSKKGSIIFKIKYRPKMTKISKKVFKFVKMKGALHCLVLCKQSLTNFSMISF